MPRPRPSPHARRGREAALHEAEPQKKASINLRAGICKGKVALWTYLPKKWNGEEAAKLVRGLLVTAVRRSRGAKRSYRMIEDNDPVGYKSRKAENAKEEVNIK